MIDTARFLLIASIFCGTIGSSRLAAAAAQPGSLRVISYNIQFLPGFAGMVNKRGNPVYRARAIGQKMAEYDLIGLNELFDKRPRELLLGEIRKAWGDKNVHVIVSPQVNPKRFTGGLAIISRSPILETHVLTYSKSSSPEKYGVAADGYATKGALHARIALGTSNSPQQTVDVFTTHLEAREDELRPSQYEELAAFIQQHTSPTRPAILMGDFNTHGDAADIQDSASPYHLMTGKFQAARPESQLVDLWPTLHQEPGGTTEQEGPDLGNRIDYIFVFNPKSAGMRLEPKSVAVNRFPDPKVTALSDHSAVEAELNWNTQAK